MSENMFSASSSKGELEQLSAIEESMASFGLGDLDSEQGVFLKDWTAQDFANIYVRFRPHLISHARKFLREETQAEEVVQDAFLYLMTALPELDSELGVLRFLKWKTKMLCLDIIRSSQAGLNNNLVPLPEDVPDEAQPHDSLERADDAAIIRLALAKLNPRHREALIATMYEDKSHEEVAQQMGVGENAFRQLLFRARASFRSALVGEAEVEGKSVSEILSIASHRLGATASKGVGVLLLAVGFGGFLSLPLMSTSEQLANENLLEIEADKTVGATERNLSRGTENVQGQEISGLPDYTNPIVPEQPLQIIEEAPPPEEVEGDSRLVNGQVSVVETANRQREVMTSNLGEEFATALAAKASEGQREIVSSDMTLEIRLGSSLSAFVGYDLSSSTIVQHMSVIYDSEIGKFTAVPTNSSSSVESDEGGNLLVEYVATDLIFGDLDGTFGNVSVEDAPVRRSGFIVNLIFSNTGDLADARFSILPRS